MNRVKFNVGGTYFETTIETLKKSEVLSAHALRWNGSSLGSSSSSNDANNNIIFLDRNPKAFSHVLEYLRNPSYPIKEKYYSELDYFCIDLPSQNPPREIELPIIQIPKTISGIQTIFPTIKDNTAIFKFQYGEMILADFELIYKDEVNVLSIEISEGYKTINYGPIEFLLAKSQKRKGYRIIPLPETKIINMSYYDYAYMKISLSSLVENCKIISSVVLRFRQSSISPKDDISSYVTHFRYEGDPSESHNHEIYFGIDKKISQLIIRACSLSNINLNQEYLDQNCCYSNDENSELKIYHLKLDSVIKFPDPAIYAYDKNHKGCSIYHCVLLRTKIC